MSPAEGEAQSSAGLQDSSAPQSMHYFINSMGGSIEMYNIVTLLNYLNRLPATISTKYRGHYGRVLFVVSRLDSPAQFTTDSKKRILVFRGRRRADTSGPLRAYASREPRG
ncbi:Hypothetical protein D9617_5g069450 [Elsinoe fawcettii]|nr:Hypothetical protein D9617_5g069450 [Elsinoe fawcettii]